MNDDPGRLFDDPSLPEELRGALQDMAERPPSYDVGAGLARFKASIGTAGGSEGGPAAGGDGATGTGIGLGKTVLIGAGGLGVVGVVAAIAFGVSRQEPAVPPAPTHVEAVMSAPAPVEVPPVEADRVPLIRPESLPTVDDARAAPSSAAVKSKDQLYREELNHLAEVKRAAASNPAQAVRMADEGHVRFVSGMLYQEREALAIRALAQSGQSSTARARGERFLSSFPKSPFADQIRMTIGLSKP